jgi:YD repeat-containing protein
VADDTQKPQIQIMKNSLMRGALRLAFASGATWLALLLPATSNSTSVQLDFTVPSSFNESNRQAVLEWNAEPAKTYLVQSATNLSPETVWKTEDAVRASTNGPIKWMAPESLRTQKYYRLILPQPEVFSVEPSFVNSDDPTALLYLIGQCFPTNGSVFINGLNFTPTLVDSNGGWMAISLNGLPPGTPILGNILVLDNSSNIVTSLPLQNPVFYGTELTAEQLQGPPDEPPASPQAVTGGWLSRKGYDYYKAQSDLNAAGLQNNPYFHENPLTGEMPQGKLSPGAIAGIAVGGFVGARAGHLVEVLEIVGHQINYALWGGGGGGGSGGKKGINAVNVKLAFSSGELESEEADLVVPGRGLDFAWTRTYRSRAEGTTAQGAGWDFSFNVSATAQPDGTVVLLPGNGRADTFYPNGTNGWTRDEYFLVIRDVDQDGSPDAVIFPDGGKWTLHPPGTSFAGKLAEIVDRNNNTLRCEYDNDTSRLLRVVDTLDRTNTVAYTSKGLIESVTDFSGRTVRYEYDSAADLIACISPAVTGTPAGNDFPGGKTNRYAYSSGNLDQRLNHNLVSITDPKGQVCLEITYHATNDPAALDFDAVSSLLRGIEKKDIRRGMVIARPSNSFATVQTIVNDYVGNVTEYLFDSRQRCVSEREFTGRANPLLPTTATENRPTGKLRSDDPDYFETRWEWNADSLCTLEIRPDGGSTEISHQRAFNQNSSRSNNAKAAPHNGNVRVVRERASSPVDTDGDGAPDTTELAWYFEYDPRFGSSPTTSRGKIVCNYVRREKATHSGSLGEEACVGNLPFSRGDGGYGDTVVARAPNKAPNITHEYHRFATSITDPRGNLTAAEYDAGGNLTRIRQRPDLLTAEWDTLIDQNIQGQITSITNSADANGNRRVDTFSYYTNGPQAGYLNTCIVDAGGLALATAFEYDDRGNVIRMVDPRGNDWLFTHNALDELIRVQTPTNLTARGQTDFLYDANGNLQEAIEERRDDADVFLHPVTTHAEFDFLDRCTALAEQVAPGVFVTNRFFYDGNGQLVAVHSPLAVSGVDTHNTVAFEYDERGLLFREIGAPGSGNSPTNQHDYTPNGACHRINKIESLTIKQSTISYDGFDRPVAATDAMSNVVNYVYDRNGNVTALSRYGETSDIPGAAGNQLLSHTAFTYDGLDREIKCHTTHMRSSGVPVSDGAAVTTFTYAPNGACLSVTDDNGHPTTYAYDSAGRLTSTTDPKLNVTTFTYDAGGNLLSETWADRSDLGGPVQQSAVIHAYDRLHRLTRTVDNVGNTNAYAYDPRGNLVLHTDPRGNDVGYQYDDLSRLTDTRSYVGARSGGITINTSHVEYDTKNRVVASTDSNTNTTTYAYDSLDRCVLVTEADGTACSLIWSPRSNLLRQQNANGTVISNSFDLLERCVRRDILPGPTVASTTTFELFAYDGLSRLTLASNDLSRVALDYDSLGNCVGQIQDGFSSGYTHDGVGNRLSLTYPSGRVVTFAYDALDQVSSMSSSSGGLPPVTLATFAYDGPGRLSRIARANNVNTRLQWNGLVNPANGAGDFGWQQIGAVNHQVSGGGSVVDRRVAAYDRNQNKIARTQTAPFYAGGSMTTNLFAYDALDRMTDFVRSTGQPTDLIRTYGLDGIGNRLVGVSNGVAAPYALDSTFPDPADFQMNQYTLTPFVLAPELYDANGNLVSRVTSAAQLQYVYDYADRLVAVQDLTGGAPETVATYSYDAVGRRMGKTIYPSGLPPVTTEYVYDGGKFESAVTPYKDGEANEMRSRPGRILEEHVGGLLTRDYAHTPEFHDWFAAGLVAAFTGTGQPQYYHCDDLGNVLALTDANGAVVERYDYDDFGLPVFLSTDGLPTGETESGVGNPFLFHGMEWEAELGWYHVRDYNWRSSGGQFLDPQTGRASHGKWKTFRGTGTGRSFSGNNPWSGGGSPSAMKKGTVKFFNETKGFGRVVGDGRVVRKMIPITQPDITGDQRGGGGSKAQDHNSSRSNKTASSIDLGGGGNGGGFEVLFNPREYTISKVQREGGRHTPFHNKYRPQSRVFTTVSNVLKTKHDTAKNSIGNIR